MSNPILVRHRCNQIGQLAGLPKGCWIEIDADMHQGAVYLHHDPLTSALDKTGPVPERFDHFLPAALKAGVAGFIIDCKRENVEKWVQPLLDEHRVKDYFYLNEMEIQADIFLEKNPSHINGIRIWKYRGAEEVIRYANDMGAAKLKGPAWAWVDCWQQGLLENIDRAYLPIDGKQAQRLQEAGVRLCICSPELYVHSYAKDYTAQELSVFERGVVMYREKLASVEIRPDAICTKFPHYWGL